MKQKCTEELTPKTTIEQEFFQLGEKLQMLIASLMGDTDKTAPACRLSNELVRDTQDAITAAMEPTVRIDAPPVTVEEMKVPTPPPCIHFVDNGCDRDYYGDYGACQVAPQGRHRCKGNSPVEPETVDVGVKPPDTPYVDDPCRFVTRDAHCANPSISVTACFHDSEMPCKHHEPTYKCKKCDTPMNIWAVGAKYKCPNCGAVQDVSDNDDKPAVPAECEYFRVRYHGGNACVYSDIRCTFQTTKDRQSCTSYQPLKGDTSE